MQDRWYADNRDLAKWGILFRLAEAYKVRRILQLAFYRPSAFGRIVIDGRAKDLPAEVIAHFRNLRTISGIRSKARVTVFDCVFKDRGAYLEAVLALLPAYARERCIVFLDPDTGLEPKNPGLEHVRDAEAGAIWKGMKKGDVFVFYQHQTNRSGQPWIEPKREQLAMALGVKRNAIRVAYAPEIANDVVIFFTQRA